jgi:hypothetical protein
VQTWLPGIAATDEDPGDSVAFAHDLAEFILNVRAIDPRGNGTLARMCEEVLHKTSFGQRFDRWMQDREFVESYRLRRARIGARSQSWAMSPCPQGWRAILA